MFSLKCFRKELPVQPYRCQQKTDLMVPLMWDKNSRLTCSCIQEIPKFIAVLLHGFISKKNTQTSFNNIFEHKAFVAFVAIIWKKQCQGMTGFLLLVYYTPGTQMTLVWLENDLLFEAKQGSFGFQVPILPISQDISYIHPFKGRIGPKARHHGRVFRHLETPPSWLECASNMPGWQRGRVVSTPKNQTAKTSKKKIEGWKMVMFLNRFVFFVSDFWRDSRKSTVQVLEGLNHISWNIRYMYICIYTVYRYNKHTFPLTPKPVCTTFYLVPLISVFLPHIGEILLHHQPHRIIRMESRLQGANIIVAYGAKKLPLKGSASNGTQALGRAKVLERILRIEDCL